eukprot:724746-Alexandrium_andersonii.AAC.1
MCGTGPDPECDWFHYDDDSLYRTSTALGHLSNLPRLWQDSFRPASPRMRFPRASASVSSGPSWRPSSGIRARFPWASSITTPQR